MQGPEESTLIYNLNRSVAVSFLLNQASYANMLATKICWDIRSSNLCAWSYESILLFNVNKSATVSFAASKVCECHNPKNQLDIRSSNLCTWSIPAIISSHHQPSFLHITINGDPHGEDRTSQKCIQAQ
jgi:hypothetical protein